MPDVALESHEHQRTEFPSSWVPGSQYVFHLNEDRDFEEIPTRLLPGRLRSVGASIVYAPKSWREMAIPNMGNPIWQIEFTQGRYRGQIRNRFEMNRRQLSDSSKLQRNLPDARIDDYVLTFAG